MKVLAYEHYVKVFPNCPSDFPDELLDDRHAAVVFGKTIRRLNQTGMTLGEIALNLDRVLDYKKMKGDVEALNTVLNSLKSYELSKLRKD